LFLIGGEIFNQVIKHEMKVGHLKGVTFPNNKIQQCADEISFIIKCELDTHNVKNVSLII
jgi:hypothetical protein